MSSAGGRVGSLEWLHRSGGRLSIGDTASLLIGLIPTVVTGVRLRRAFKRKTAPRPLLRQAEPPSTPIVAEARAFLDANCDPAMANHAYRTGYRTALVLLQLADASPDVLETAWAAALLHDVGLDQPVSVGDFSSAGVELLGTLGRKHGWSPERIFDASQAIASNLCTDVRQVPLGVVSWAMNVGGLGEVTYGPFRDLADPDLVAEFEARYPRTGFRAAALRLIDAEAKRVPGGRFALARPFFYVLLRE